MPKRVLQIIAEVLGGKTRTDDNYFSELEVQDLKNEISNLKKQLRDTVKEDIEIEKLQKENEALKEVKGNLIKVGQGLTKQLEQKDHEWEEKIKENVSKLTLIGYKGNPEGYLNAKLLLKQLNIKED